MAFKIRRGTNAERLTITPAQGELIYTTDTKKLYVGDGATLGGIAADFPYNLSEIADPGAAGPALVINPGRTTYLGSPTSSDEGNLVIERNLNGSTTSIIRVNQRHEVADSHNITFYRSRGTATAPTQIQNNDEVLEFRIAGRTAPTVDSNLGFLTFYAKTAGATPSGMWEFVNGTSISFQIDENLTARVKELASIGTNTDLDIKSNGTGFVKINNLKYPKVDGNAGNILTTNGTGELSWSPQINLTGYATETYVTNAVSNAVTNLVDGAPNLLNTLNELAAAVADDANFAASTTTALGNRIRYDDVQTLTASQKLVAQSNIGLDAAALQSDWTQSDNSTRDFIKNKPTIPNLAAVAQNILPTTDVTYDLGSPTKRFKDLYLSGSTIDLGGKTLSISGGTLSVGGNKFGESGNVVGVAITQFYNNTVYIRLDVGSAAETIANSIVKGDILKLDPYGGYAQIPQLTVVSNDGGIVDTNNTSFKDYLITVAETGPGSAQNIFFDLIKPIASDVNQLQDSDGLLDRTSISSGPTAPGSSAVATANSVDINFSDGVGNKFKFNRDGKIDFPAAQYGSSVSTMFVDYGFRFRPTWNGVGTGPELAVSWNDGIELTPITNDHFTGSNRATPFFIQGTYTSVAGKLPGNVYIDGGRNGPADVNGDVLIGSGYTKSTTIGQSNATIYIPGYAGQAADEAVQIRNVASANSVLQLFGRGEVQFITNTGATEKVFKFRDDAKLELPAGGDIIDSTGASVLGGGDITGDQNVDGGGGAVDVWSSPVNTAGMTARVVVSGKDLASGETQSCEVLLAKKQGSQSISATVYGIVHTSATPLFTVSATVETDGQIRVNATVPGSITTVNVKSVGRVTVL
jgi:hypothetical protein